MTEFIKINNKIMNLSFVKVICYSAKDENLCIRLSNDSGIWKWYVPVKEANIILYKLHEAIQKKETEFDFHFTKPYAPPPKPFYFCGGFKNLNKIIP